MDWELVEQLGLQAPVVLDRCSKSWFFEKPYKVKIGERSEWEGNSHELTKQGLIWFTDGSKTEKGVGAATWRQGSGHEVVCSLDIHATVFPGRGQGHCGVCPSYAGGRLQGIARSDLLR